MEQRKPETFALTLRLPSDLQARLDATARKLHMNRTNFIVKSINRNLKYCAEVELPLISTEIQEVLST
jgi:predicted transcriptional regulator